MEFEDMAAYGLDPNQEDFEDWLKTPEGRAVAEEMGEQGDDIMDDLDGIMTQHTQ